MPVAPWITEVQSIQQTVTLKLDNMTCAMCAVTIKKALQQVEGVQKVIVNYDTKTALVTFDNQKTNISVLINSTTNAGYTSSLVTTNSL